MSTWLERELHRKVRTIVEQRVAMFEDALLIDAVAMKSALHLQRIQPRADYTIDQLPAGGVGTNTDEVPIFRNGNTLKVLLANLPYPGSTNSLGIVSVTTFGAVGNGVTDDTAAIQAALNAATMGSATFGNGVVYFPPGTFIVSTPFISNTNNVHFVGSGIDVTIIRIAAGAFTNGNYHGGGTSLGVAGPVFGPGTVGGNTAVGLSFTDMTIDGNYLNAGAPPVGATNVGDLIHMGSFSVSQRVKFLNGNNFKCWIAGATGAHVLDCIFDYTALPTRGVNDSIDGGNNLTIGCNIERNVYTSNVSCSALDFVSSIGCSFRGNRIFAPPVAGQNGVVQIEGCIDFTIEDNYWQSGGVICKSNASYNPVLVNDSQPARNKIINNTFDFTYVSQLGAPYFVTPIRIEYSIYTGAPGHNPGGGNIVRGNVIRNVQGYGIATVTGIGTAPGNAQPYMTESDIVQGNHIINWNLGNYANINTGVGIIHAAAIVIGCSNVGAIVSGNTIEDNQVVKTGTQAISLGQGAGGVTHLMNNVQVFDNLVNAQTTCLVVTSLDPVPCLNTNDAVMYGGMMFNGVPWPPSGGASGALLALALGGSPTTYNNHTHAPAVVYCDATGKGTLYQLGPPGFLTTVADYTTAQWTAGAIFAPAVAITVRSGEVLKITFATAPNAWVEQLVG